MFRKTFAGKSTLETIQYLPKGANSLRKLHGLPKGLATSLAHLFFVLHSGKFRYAGVKMYSAALLCEINRIDDCDYSIRSLQRALSVLESRGLIHRYSNRFAGFKGLTIWFKPRLSDKGAPDTPPPGLHRQPAVTPDEINGELAKACAIDGHTELHEPPSHSYKDHKQSVRNIDKNESEARAFQKPARARSYTNPFEKLENEFPLLKTVAILSRNLPQRDRMGVQCCTVLGLLGWADTTGLDWERYSGLLSEYGPQPKGNGWSFDARDNLVREGIIDALLKHKQNLDKMPSVVESMFDDSADTVNVEIQRAKLERLKRAYQDNKIDSVTLERLIKQVQRDYPVQIKRRLVG